MWWCGTLAIPAAPPPDDGHTKPTTLRPSILTTTATKTIISSIEPSNWLCPAIVEQPVVECSCDMPHTLRCTGDKGAMDIISVRLRNLSTSISLLDCTVQNVSILATPLLQGVALHGLVFSSGELKQIYPSAFEGLTAPLQALGLPNNKLAQVPTAALQHLVELDRLDLSSNVMKSLETDSFKSLQNLSFIDLSDNIISKIAPTTFTNLPQLRILRLRGNHITIQTIAKLRPFKTVEDLDLSGNAFVGPLDPYSFPKMESLKDLQLSHNSLSSIKMGALAGLIKISILSLHHNQIDVLEDNAFSYLRSLTTLDLSHNRIVAVSGGSLAGLSNLVNLDLRHNFLRALTADLILPLQKLGDLRLDDNDLSIVSSDALRNNTILKRLTLSENPLNCDCTITEFALWLTNSGLSKEDKASAVCTTPPSLENGLLIEVQTKDLQCGDEDDIELMSLSPTTESVKARINLQSFTYDGNQIKLQWWVEEKAVPYSCDAIFVYEEEGPNEVLLESNPLRCNSSAMEDPKILEVQVPGTAFLQKGHRYRYCVVLLESDQLSDELSLVLGCSDVMPLVQNVKLPPKNLLSDVNAKVIAVKANLSQLGDLAIDVSIFPKASQCDINIALLEQTALLSQKRVNCSQPTYTFVGLDAGGPFRVCANIISSVNLKPRCVTVFRKEHRSLSGLDIAFVTIFLALSVMIVGLIWGVRRVLLRPKQADMTHQCFMAPADSDCQDQQHTRYVKLQATTKL